jgi:O-antigen/teichoic acid export membrane protein
MLRKIFFTFSSRLFITCINFIVILLTARYLGAEGRGVISLIILGITINLLVSNIFGGSAISYLAVRVQVYKLVAPAYTWAVISSFLITSILITIKLIPAVYAPHLFFLSVLQSFYNVHLNLLIGKGHIKEHNLVNSLQVAVLVLLLCFLLFVLQQRTVYSYLIALYCSLGFSFFLSLFFLRDEVKMFPIRDGLDQWKRILSNGYIIQIANIAQLLNYRLSYYLLDHFTNADEGGKKIVGVYSTAVAIAEAVWLIGRSMGLVQYTKIVKGEDDNNAINLSLRFGKISFLLTIVILLPVIILPSGFYKMLFGNDFGNIQEILLYLSPGILSFGMALMYSNYFAGLGLNTVNLKGSLTGLAISISAGIFLVPEFGMRGAAITASLSYIATSLYLWISFTKRTKLRWTEIVPAKNDLIFLRKEFLKYFSEAGTEK